MAVTEEITTTFKEPASVAQIRERVRSFVGRVPDELIVSTHDEAQHATNLLVALRQIKTDAEQERKRVTKPLLDEKRFLDATYKMVVDPLDQAERVVKAGLLARQRKIEAAAAETRRQELARADEERKRQEADARAAEALGFVPTPTQAITVEMQAPPSRSISTGAGTTTFRKVWKIEVEDIRELCAAIAAGAVPTTFVEADSQAIRAALMAHPAEERGSYHVPGIRIYQDDTVATS